MTIRDFQHRRQTLAHYVAECSCLEYREGVFDCCLFVGAWADILSGKSRFRELLAGSYDEKLSGLRRWAPKGIYVAVRDYLLAGGWIEIPAYKARDGDISFYRSCPAIITRPVGFSVMQTMLPKEGCVGVYCLADLKQSQPVFRWER